MPSEPIDVNTIREQNLMQLKKKVDIAFSSAKFVTLKEGSPTDEIDQAADSYNELSQYSNQENVELIFPEKNNPDCVYVENPHDYADLLRMSIERVGQDKRTNIKTLISFLDKFPKANKISEALKKHLRNSITKNVNATLKHEMAHAVPAIANEHTKLYYAVKFVQFDNPTKTSFYPFIGMEGHLTRHEIDDVLQGPDRNDLSPVDRVLMGEPTTIKPATG